MLTDTDRFYLQDDFDMQFDEMMKYLVPTDTVTGFFDGKTVTVYTNTGTTAKYDSVSSVDTEGGFLRIYLEDGRVRIFSSSYVTLVTVE